MAGRLPHAHLVQFSIRWEDAAANHEQVRALLDKADVQAGDLILLPEMFDTGFSFNIEKTNDKSGATLTAMLELADDTGALVQGGRTIAPCHRCAAKNVMTAVAPGQRVLAEYAKQHLFTMGGEFERFEAGRGVESYVWPAANLRVMPAVCYDLRFPELFAAGLRSGAQLIALGACWPSVRAHHWRALLIARAIENQAFVLGVNRTGDDPAKPDGTPGLHYAGGSMIISPMGDVLAEAGDAPCVLSAPIDAALLHVWREKFPPWRERRDVHSYLQP
jgi:omega-amidase